MNPAKMHRNGQKIKGVLLVHSRPFAGTPSLVPEEGMGVGGKLMSVVNRFVNYVIEFSSALEFNGLFSSWTLQVVTEQQQLVP